MCSGGVMISEQVERAKDEALRFVERAERLLAKATDVDAQAPIPKWKEVGLVRRASLDLSSALADMRQARGRDVE
jgi:hypothetical protein